jgi:hypothetical protein
MSVGITLAAPLHAAHAQTNLPTTNNTVVLSHYGVNENPFTISNGTVIGTDFDGIDGSTGRYTISNAGTVTSSDATGILLNGGGTIITSGTIEGRMSGNNAGILLNNRISTIVNTGLITGNTGAEITYGGGINNISGTIGGGILGAFVNGKAGNVYNGGTIKGATAVELNAGGFVDNGGSIVGGTIGVDVSGAAGVVNNWAEDGPNFITGGQYGVVIASPGGSLITRGLISETGSLAGNAAVLMNGGYIYNKGAIGTLAAGFIIGDVNAILGTGTQGLNIRNEGVVEGDVNAVTLGDAGGVIVNGGTGWISGFAYAGINATGGSMNVSNAGFIAGGEYGINDFTSTPSLYGQLGGVTVSNTGTIVGNDNTGIFVNTGFTSIDNAGLILGGVNGVYAQTGARINNTGSIIGGDTGVYINGSFGVLHNNGSLTADYISGSSVGVFIVAPDGTLITRGVITQSAGGSGYAGVIMNGGYIYNQGAGSGGNAGIIQGYANGIIADGTNAIDILNNGTIQGTGFDTVGGTTTNGIVLGAAGGTIINGPNGFIYGAFGDGIVSNYGSFSVHNSGTILGYNYGIRSYSATAGSGGAVNITNGGGTILGNGGGIYVDSGYASIQNSGLIQGLADNGITVKDGASVNNMGSIFGVYGIYSSMGSLNVTNGGTIIGTKFGIYDGSGTATITNSGTITGVQFEGIDINGGGMITNTGTITGGEFGIYGYSNPVSIINTGLILGTVESGIEIDNGGFVYNSGSGSIIGAYDGVAINFAYGSVVNRGFIQGTSFAGVGIYGNGTVANLGGTISGFTGVEFGYAGSTITSTGNVYNSGVILGNSFAGVAMYNGGGVFNAPDGTIAALSTAGLGIVMYGTFGSVNNDGVILGGSLGVGVSFGADGLLTNAGSIYGGTGVRISGTVVGPEDVSSTGVQNFGIINGGSIGVDLVDGGVVGNSWAGGCDPNIGSIYGSISGVQVDAGFGLIENTGTIGGGENGILLGGSLGVVANHDFVENGALGIGTIFGGNTGVLATNGFGYVFNSGVIHGNIAGVSLLDGGVVHNGVYSTTIGSMPVSFAGTINGGVYGVYASSLASATVFNAGLIAGDDAGVDLVGGGTVINGPGAHIYAAGYGVVDREPARICQ